MHIRRRASVAFICLLLSAGATPARAGAVEEMVEFLHKLSGPGPFIGGGLQFWHWDRALGFRPIVEVSFKQSVHNNLTYAPSVDKTIWMVSGRVGVLRTTCACFEYGISFDFNQFIVQSPDFHRFALTGILGPRFPSSSWARSLQVRLTWFLEGFKSEDFGALPGRQFGSELVAGIHFRFVL